MDELREGETTEERARRVANIIGPNSAAAQALRKLERLRGAGHDAELYWANGAWWVGMRNKERT